MKMRSKFTEANIRKLEKALPYNAKKIIAKRLEMSYPTVCDAFKNIRKAREDRTPIYQTAIEVLRERGLTLKW